MRNPRSALRKLVSTTLVAGALFAGLSSPGVARAEAHVGQPAPDFTLPAAADGKSVALKPLLAANKGVVLIFIATRCPFSNAYNDRMAALARDYEKKGIAVVGINANKTESAADAAAHAKEHGFGFPVVKDDGAKIADAYGAQHTPEAYLVDQKGTLVYHGRIDEEKDNPKDVKSPDLKNAIDALVAGSPIKVSETKAFGCSIKR